MKLGKGSIKKVLVVVMIILAVTLSFKLVSRVKSELRAKAIMNDLERDLEKLDNKYAEETKQLEETTLKIGMTVEEVKATGWANPKKINKTVTKMGVREQWVYYGNTYIYFENGIVTAIQHH